jgi:hypothetical protein
MHILGWQRRAAVEKLSIGNENPGKEGYVAKTRHTSQPELGGGAAKRDQKNGAPGEIRTPDLIVLFRSYSWPNWPGLGQGVSGCKN